MTSQPSVCVLPFVSAGVVESLYSRYNAKVTAKYEQMITYDLQVTPLEHVQAVLHDTLSPPFHATALVAVRVCSTRSEPEHVARSSAAAHRRNERKSEQEGLGCGHGRRFVSLEAMLPSASSVA